MARRYLLADFSNNNASVNLTRVRQAGVIGFWHKVTEGQTFVDREWAGRAEEGRRHGLRVGGYHFARPNGISDAELEAQFFCRHLGQPHRRDLAPVLDLEVAEGMSGRHLEIWARIFMHGVHNTLGIWPLFYSFPSFVESMNAKKVIGRGIWLASFGRNDGQEHPFRTPAPFRKALAHQFTSNARIAGVAGSCDLSSASKLYPLLARGLRGL